MLHVFRVKGRPSTHPLIVHIDHPRYVQRWVRELTPEAKRLADAFWPGPLTLVAKRAPAVNDIITGGQDTIAIRGMIRKVSHLVTIEPVD